MVRWLEEQGLQAGSFSTEYGVDDDEVPGAGAGAPDARPLEATTEEEGEEVSR
jgi:hypothetical protein